MQRKTAFPLVGLLLLMVATGPAPAAPLTLDDVIALALEGNHQLRLAQAGVDLAAAAGDESRAGRRPQIVFEELVSATTNPALAFSQLLGQEAFTQADFAVDRLNNPDSLTNFTSRLSIYQPIWSGGETRSRSEESHFRHEAAQLDRDRTRQETIHQVVQAYSAALLAEDRQKVAQDALDTAHEHVRMAEDLAAAGLVVEADVLMARVRVSEVQEMLVSATGNMEVAAARLNLVMGRDLSTPVQLTPLLLDGNPAAGEEAVAALVDQAWSSRPDLKAAGQRVEATRWLGQGMRAGHRPEIGLGGAVEANAEQFIGADGTNWTIMGTLRWTLYDGGVTRSRLQQAQETITAARLQEEFMREEISLQVREAVRRRDTARENRSLSGAAVAMARESLRMVADRYAEGLIPLVHLLETEDSYTRARFREAGARHELFVADSYVNLVLGQGQEGAS